tara:strand:+ start:2964 stop:3257 length:294 start_codon:yes stop_codon:yes gene_type:complete
MFLIRRFLVISQHSDQLVKWTMNIYLKLTKQLVTLKMGNRITKGMFAICKMRLSILILNGILQINGFRIVFKHPITEYYYNAARLKKLILVFDLEKY